MIECDINERDKMDTKDMTDVIYDTLMQNKQHEQLNLDKVENQEVDRKRGWITFEYEGKIIYINIHDFPSK